MCLRDCSSNISVMQRGRVGVWRRVSCSLISLIGSHCRHCHDAPPAEADRWSLYCVFIGSYHIFVGLHTFMPTFINYKVFKSIVVYIELCSACRVLCYQMVEVQRR